MSDSKSTKNAIIEAIDIVGDKWTLLIVREFVISGPRRFLDLQEGLKVSPNTLSARLKRMERDGLISRKLYSSTPPRSEYVLTDRGHRLEDVLTAINDWAQ